MSTEEVETAIKLKEEGNHLFKQKKYQKAIDKYSEAIAIDPKNAIFYCNRAAAFSAWNLDKYVISAVLDAEKAIELNPNYAKAYYRLAGICSKKGCPGKAILNYQRAINCTGKNDALLNQCRTEIKRLQKQSIMKDQAHAMFLQETIALHAVEKDKLKRKYKNEIILSMFGYRAEQLAKYSGPKDEGEIEMSLYEILNDAAMFHQAAMMDPEAGVKLVDELLKNNQIYQIFGLGSNKENIPNSANSKKSTEKAKMSHIKKYAKIKELKKSRQEWTKYKKQADTLYLKATFGIMEFNMTHRIEGIEKAIENNESDTVWEERYEEEEEMNPEFLDNIYGVPDVMAKRLLFEYRMLPWDPEARETIAKMYNW